MKDKTKISEAAEIKYPYFDFDADGILHLAVNKNLCFEIRKIDGEIDTADYIALDRIIENDSNKKH